MGDFILSVISLHPWQKTSPRGNISREASKGSRAFHSLVSGFIWCHFHLTLLVRGTDLNRRDIDPISWGEDIEEFRVSKLKSEERHCLAGAGFWAQRRYPRLGSRSLRKGMLLQSAAATERECCWDADHRNHKSTAPHENKTGWKKSLLSPPALQSLLNALF